MKKHITLLSLLLVCAMLLTGCQCSHEWTAADCTTPKTCTKCQETEGEALGHTWQEASCSAPKTCTACALTEGEPLAHTWQEANYQQSETCTVCAATEGEPLTASFEEMGIVIDITGPGGSCDFAADGKNFTMTVKEYQTMDAQGILDFWQEKMGDQFNPEDPMLKGLTDLDGYGWKMVYFTVESREMPNMNYIPLLPDYGDYYDLEGEVASVVESPTEPTRYTVNYLGEDYDQCGYYQWSTWSHTASENYLEIHQWMFFRLPEGYDGMVVSCGDAANIQGDYFANYKNHYTDENTVFFRMK